MKLFLKGPESTIYNIFKWMSMTLQFACEVLIMTATIPGGKTHTSVDMYVCHVNTLNLGD